MPAWEVTFWFTVTAPMGIAPELGADTHVLIEQVCRAFRVSVRPAALVQAAEYPGLRAERQAVEQKEGCGALCLAPSVIC